MTITDAEIKKYRTYIEEGTMDEVARKLGITPGAVSDAVRNLEKKVSDSLENIKLALELELPFKRIKKEAFIRKLRYIFELEIEVFPVPKKQVEKLTKILEDQQEGSIENFILNCVLEKIKKHKVFK